MGSWGKADEVAADDVSFLKCTRTKERLISLFSVGKRTQWKIKQKYTVTSSAVPILGAFLYFRLRSLVESRNSFGNQV